MLLWHATPRFNLPSIRAEGLDPERSRGRLRVVWLHAATLSADLVELVAVRHGVWPDQVALVAVSVPRSRLRRWRRCLWYCAEMIPPARLLVPGRAGSIAVLAE